MQELFFNMNNLFKIISFVVIINACTGKIGGELKYIEPHGNSDYNYAYFLFIPENLIENKKITLIVEPNNSGFASDKVKEHTEKAKRQATREFYAGNYVARKLNLPLLVPVFPRPEEEWKIYTHALDRDAMLQKNNDLERIDLQLLAMINEAQQKLREMGYIVDEQIFMTGFSASGTFANRFSLIHPDRVKAYAAGGINGLLMLPIDSLGAEPLPYPVGASDFEKLFGKPFDLSAFKNLPQFLFMGELDENDAIPYEDGYSVEERNLIYEVLGKDMMPQRWNKCKQIYLDLSINAKMKTYNELGHEQPKNVKEDIVEFFKEQLQATEP